MKLISWYIILMIFLSETVIYADQPGGGYDGYRTFTAIVYVYDSCNNPVEGVKVSLYAEVFGTEGNGSNSDHSITSSSGGVVLSTTVYYQGYEDGHYVYTTFDNWDHTVISALNTYSWVSYNLYPEYEVVSHLALAQKFCPTMKLHHSTEWIAPEPVEYLGVTKQDLWFLLYNINGQAVRDYPISSQAQFYPPISNTYQWVISSNPNYSFLTGNGYFYNGRPPGKTIGRYYLRFHYNYAGDANSPSQWISYYQTERNQNNFHHTVYAHVFTYNSKPVIQYWFYYPYNDGYNNHEGDWEHINVRLNNFNLASSSIEAIDFYFHHKVKTLTSGYQLDDATHPIVYVGGSCANVTGGCEPGNATGGSYPWPGRWNNVGPISYDEYVWGNGPTIPHESISIVVLPNPNEVNYDVNPELCWLKISIRFGYLEVSSPWDFFEPFIFWSERDIGNDAPLGPAFNKGWGKIGAVEGAYDQY
ncbi:MAG: hypothetical protein SCK70_00305 [bacterium]|nr:hypothetical protein [bacterium]